MTEAPGAGEAAPRENGVAIAALVFGVASIVPLWGALASPLALVLGWIGYARARRGAPYGSLATAAIILGFVGLLFAAFVLMFFVAV